MRVCVCARALVCVSGREADLRAQICGQGAQGWRGGGTKWHSQTPRECSLISQPPPALPWAQDRFLIGDSVSFVHWKPWDDWLPQGRFPVGARLPGEVGSGQWVLVPVASARRSAARGGQRFALLQARLAGIPNSMSFAPFGLSEKSKSQTGSLSLHRSCSSFLSDSEITQRGREIRDPEID